jgi:hypothetical protein
MSGQINSDPIYPQDAAPWIIQQKIFRDDWRTVGTVPRANHTRSEALARYAHMNGRLRAVSQSQAQRDYEAGRAHKP